MPKSNRTSHPFFKLAQQAYIKWRKLAYTKLAEQQLVTSFWIGFNERFDWLDLFPVAQEMIRKAREENPMCRCGVQSVLTALGWLNRCPGPKGNWKSRFWTDVGDCLECGECQKNMELLGRFRFFSGYTIAPTASYSNAG